MPSVNVTDRLPQKQEGHSRKKDDIAFPRGVVLTAENVDYSDNSLKDMKPPYSYAMMIAQAILSSEGEQLTLSAIYSFITEKYAFYRHSNTGWQVGLEESAPRFDVTASNRLSRIPSGIISRSTRHSGRFPGAPTSRERA
jgi:hypothetical protein